MPKGFQKGHKKIGGKQKGSVNKSTETARLAIAKLVNENTDNMINWLDQIAQESPKDAFDCVIKVMEYHIPKLNRTDLKVTGDPNQPVTHVDLSKLSDEDLRKLRELNERATINQDE